MTNPCDDLILFIDGELERAQADAFRLHLASCAACQAGMVEAVQLSARLAALGDDPGELHEDRAGAARVPSDDPPRLSRSPGLQGLRDLQQDAPDLPVRRAMGRTKRRLLQRAGIVLAAAAIFLVFVVGIPQRPPGESPDRELAALTTRPYPVRFAYPAIAGYREIAKQKLGAVHDASERVPYRVLDALEKRQDSYGLAIARVWNNEDLGAIADTLAHLKPQTSAVRADLAAIQSLTTSEDNAGPILAELEGLQRDPDAMVARAARWNYALLLNRLDLRFSAARAFRAIAADEDAGWRAEASTLAEHAEALVKGFVNDRTRVVMAGRALIADGTPPPDDLIRAFPGVLRADFYSAVRIAPSRARVLALRPLAQQLDQLDGHRALSAYVERIGYLSQADFDRRAPLVAAYADALKHQPIADELERELTTETVPAYAEDLAMGVMTEEHAVVQHVELFRALAKRADDPWFDIAAAQAEATGDEQRGEWLSAVARLTKAEGLCNAALTKACLTLDRQLAALYTDAYFIHSALDVLRRALRIARVGGDWAYGSHVLWQLADAERFHDATASVRAYAHEYLAMLEAAPTELQTDDRCQSESWAYRTLTGAALLDVDGKAARANLEKAWRCGALDLTIANFLADVARLDPRPGDLPQLQAVLAQVRGSGTLSPAQRAMADEIEGRLLIERDRATGVALLEKAIARARTLPSDMEARKASAGAYSVEVFDAAHHGDYPRALQLIANHLELAPPEACAVGMLAEDERATVVAIAADGQVRGSYDHERQAGSLPPVVPPDLAASLTGCESVQVMAAGALQGAARVLPRNIAWSYVGAAHRPESAGVAPVAAQRRLVVTAVTPPPELHLGALSVSRPSADPLAVTLSGSAATPKRVLAEMVDASEIDFHVHALLHVGVSDASHLVLSPDPDGKYALTAEAIRGVELRGRPLVVLAACRSAVGAHYQHAPWSLPVAFLSAGARAVLAAATEIPDRESSAVLDRLVAQIRAGARPAVALRDARTVASPAETWVDDLVVFE